MIPNATHVARCIALVCAALAWPSLASAAPTRPTPSSRPAPGTSPAPPGTDAEPDVQLSGDEGGPAGFNTCRRQPRGTRFKITLPEEAELKDLINWMMTITCQKFIWDPKVRGTKVTILSPEAVTVEEAYAAFYAALETMGLTVEPSGRYFKIVETSDAKSRNLPVYGPEGRAPDNDRFVTQLYRTRGGKTKDIVDLLTKLKTKQGSVDTVDDLIILTDSGSSVQRLLDIVRQIDDPALSSAKEKIFFFQLQYAEPEETAETIRQIFGEKQPAGGGQAAANRNRNRNAAQNTAPVTEGEPTFSRVVVDERTGTLVIVAPEADYAVIRRLIERLDVPLAGGGGRIHVVKLKNADPEEVAQVLTQLGTGARGGAAGGAQGGARGAQGGRNQPQNANPANPEAAELFSGDIKVTPDPATRSLVILGSNTDFKALLEVIRVLDEPRKQVYIEVYLLELKVGDVLRGGAAGHFGRDVDVNGQSGIGFVGSTPNPTAQNSILLSGAMLQGLAAGVLGPIIPNSGALLQTGRDIPAFGVVIQALQEDNDVNFVAEPHIYTADNQEANIEVGRNVPTPGALAFPGGGQGGGIVPVASVQRQNVTLKVTITPHVNDDKQVTLDVEMQNDDIESVDPTYGVTTTTRRLKQESIVARDDEPVVLGGLVQEVERISTKQVPGLGSIPLLGWLFKSKQTTKDKVNLLMILVPHILETPDDARRIHARRLKERLEFLERYTGFKRRDLDAHVNYRKKSGLLAEVNRAATGMDAEARFRERAEAELRQQVITGELGLSPSFEENDVETTDAAATDTAPSAAPTPEPPRQRPRNRER